jgi:hypothetical protein
VLKALIDALDEVYADLIFYVNNTKGESNT